MEIFIEYEDPYFAKSARILENCYIIKEGFNTYHYEFEIKDSSAYIKSDTTLYLEEIAKAFHKNNPTISIFKAKDFYMELPSPFTFKLPISILQVSKFFLNQRYIEELNTIPNIKIPPIPVQIIEDEYVVLDHHHLLYLAKKQDDKMVDVYLDNLKPHTKDYLYLAKEQNIKTIEDVKCLPLEQYKKIKLDLETIFSTYTVYEEGCEYPKS